MDPIGSHAWEAAETRERAIPLCAPVTRSVTAACPTGTDAAKIPAKPLRWLSVVRLGSVRMV